MYNTRRRENTVSTFPICANQIQQEKRQQKEEHMEGSKVVNRVFGVELLTKRVTMGLLITFKKDIGPANIMKESYLFV